MIDPREPMRDDPPSGEVLATLPSAMFPARAAHQGRAARLEPLDPARHADDLYASSHADDRARRVWTYLPYGPFATPAAFSVWLRECAAAADPVFFAVRDLATDRVGGMTSFLAIRPLNGVVELGHIWFGPALQNSPAATDALFLMLRHALDDLAYRRAEWKCDALNAASRSAAARLGFTFEGLFYQHVIVKGRNRDTAWYSILDHEWPRLRSNFETWLAPENFAADGCQIRSLRELNRSSR